ncbi:unnamed protein product [Symbiodinium natans]|uniref:Uncharacterized protein n=1 Tax=Symbiodinium natans TaxID=878477 RepID=A0A812LNI7_9DINO|nr:unnamed protein product [Symbiodinium natans]
MAKMMWAMFLMLMQLGTVKACDSYNDTNATYCESMKDDGCTCVWMNSTSSCSTGSVCDNTTTTTTTDPNATTTTTDGGGASISAGHWAQPGLLAVLGLLLLTHLR